MYKLLIVDDEPLMQVGIKSMIDCEKLNVIILGLASNGKVALDMIEKEMPDIVICDIRMPAMSGLDLIKICCERYGYGIPVFIFLTSYEEFTLAKKAITYQASDYLIKMELTPQILEEAIKKAAGLIKNKNVSTSSGELESFLKNEEQFYIRLLQNMFENREQFHLQCSFLGISLDAPAYQCIYLELSEPAEQDLSSERIFHLFTSCFSLLLELLPKYLKGKGIPLDVKHCAILLEKTPEECNEDDSRIMSVLEQLNLSIQRYYNVTFRAGLGTPENDPFEIWVSYQTARQAFFRTSVRQPLISYTGLSNQSETHETFNLSLFREDLSHSVAEFNGEQFVQVIQDLCAIFAEHPAHISQALDASCSILYMVISSIPGGEQTVADMFRDYPDHYRSIYRQHTIEQINAWLKYFAGQVSDYFSDRRNNHTNYTVNIVRQYIHEHLSEKLTLNEVSSIFNITPNYLSQLFRKYNDIGFNEYVTVSKINEAKSMLAAGQMKIYEVSDALGFESSFYFSKVFKKIEGISPKEYLNQKLG